jgi:hypothetical protein
LDKSASFVGDARLRRSTSPLGGLVFRDLRFPIVYVLEILVVIPLLGSFVAVTSFLAAQPVASLDLRGKHLPSGWEAAVLNHGNYLRGYTIANHPIRFVIALLVLVVSVAMLYRIHRAQMTQRAAAYGPQIWRHNIAHACVFAAWALYGYILVTHLLVGISPA